MTLLQQTSAPIYAETPDRGGALSLKPDADLVALSRNGSRQAFALLWTRHYVAATTCARQTWSNPHDVDDVVSEAFARVLDAIKKGNGPTTKFRPYLFQVIRNLGAENFRHAQTVPSDLDEIASDKLGPEDEMVSGTDQSVILRAFYAMKPRERQILWSHEVEELPPRQIAEQMGLGPRHVSTLLDRARQSFKAKWLQANVDDFGEANGEHAWVLGHLGQVMAEQATRITNTRVSRHLGDCDSCRHSAVKVKNMATELGLKLGSAVVGVGAGSLGMAGYVSAAEAASPPALPAAIAAKVGAAVSGVVRAVVAGLALIVAVGAMVFLWHPTTTGADSPPPAIGVVTPSTTPTPSASPTPTPTPTVTPSATPSSTPTPTPSASPSATSTQVTTTEAPPTTAAVPAIGIGGVDSGPNNVCYPVVSGTGVPGSVLSVSNGGASTVSVTTAADGTWRTGPLDGYPAGGRPVIVTDPSGQQAQATGSVTLTAPPTLGVTRTGTDLVVVVGGLASTPVSISADGTVIWQGTLDATGQASFEGQIPVDQSGHDISVRYAASCESPQDSIHIQS